VHLVTTSVEATSYYAERAAACGVPSYMIPGLARYFDNHIAPGSFLMAVLQNDLMKALNCADSTNIDCLKAYGRFLYNHAPLGSYGSRENVDMWLERRDIPDDQEVRRG
jgi:hypothetical protein